MNSNPFSLDQMYEFHVQGFNEPVVGKIVDIGESGEDILLVIQESEDSAPVTIFQKFITGWTIQGDKREIAA